MTQRYRKAVPKSESGQSCSGDYASTPVGCTFRLTDKPGVRYGGRDFAYRFARIFSLFSTNILVVLMLLL